MLKIKHYLRHENKVNENKVLSYCKALRCETIKKQKFSFMSNLQTYYHFTIDWEQEQLEKLEQKVDQHTGGKWLIYDTTRREDNQLQSLELPCRIS